MEIDLVIPGLFGVKSQLPSDPENPDYCSDSPHLVAQKASTWLKYSVSVCNTDYSEERNADQFVCASSSNHGVRE
jgi:hypothetical protein